jgi:hypothetical protein
VVGCVDSFIFLSTLELNVSSALLKVLKEFKVFDVLYELVLVVANPFYLFFELRPEKAKSYSV